MLVTVIEYRDFAHFASRVSLDLRFLGQTWHARPIPHSPFTNLARGRKDICRQANGSNRDIGSILSLLVRK